MEQVQQRLDQLLLHIDGFVDSPYTYLLDYMSHASLRLRSSKPILLLTERNPKTWATKRKQNHRTTWWCRDLIDPESVQRLLLLRTPPPLPTANTTTTTTTTTTPGGGPLMDYFACIKRMKPKLLALQQQQHQQEQLFGALPGNFTIDDHDTSINTSFIRTVTPPPATSATTPSTTTTRKQEHPLSFPPRPLPFPSLGCHLFATTIDKVPLELLEKVYQHDLEYYLRPMADYRIDLFEQSEEWTTGQLADDIRTSLPWLCNTTFRANIRGPTTLLNLYNNNNTSITSTTMTRHVPKKMTKKKKIKTTTMGAHARASSTTNGTRIATTSSSSSSSSSACVTYWPDIILDSQLQFCG
jgi:hypothetical protein